MMKKIKLLTPILTLTTAGSALVAATSCNKSNGFDISKEQWDKVFDMIGDPYNEDRNFTLEGKWYMYDDESAKLEQIRAFGLKAVKGINDAWDSEDSPFTEKDTIYSVIHDGIVCGAIAKNEQAVPIRHDYVYKWKADMLEIMELACTAFKDNYDKLSKTGDHKYLLNLISLGFAYIDVNFEFDSKNNLTNIILDFYYKFSETLKESYTKFEISFANYGTTTTDITEDSFKYTENFDTASWSTDKFSLTRTLPNNESDAIKFQKSDGKDVGGFNKINITTENVKWYSPTLSLNGAYLCSGIDFTVSSDLKQIVLNKPLNDGDKLYLILNYTTASVGDKITFELTK